jgi:hypothetical protein
MDEVSRSCPRKTSRAYFNNWPSHLAIVCATGLVTIYRNFDQFGRGMAGTSILVRIAGPRMHVPTNLHPDLGSRAENFVRSHAVEALPTTRTRVT